MKRLARLIACGFLGHDRRWLTWWYDRCDRCGAIIQVMEHR